MFDPPAAGIELYSATEVAGKGVKDSAIIDRRMGREESARDYNKRKKFFNRELAERFYRDVSVKGKNSTPG